MEHNLFIDLVQSLKEAKDIKRARAIASDQVNAKPIDVKVVREQAGLSQSEFARLIRVSLKTLQDWERHRRHPRGPAAALLKVLMVAPDVALNVLKLDANRARN